MLVFITVLIIIIISVSASTRRSETMWYSSTNVLPTVSINVNVYHTCGVDVYPDDRKHVDDTRTGARSRDCDLTSGKGGATRRALKSRRLRSIGLDPVRYRAIHYSSGRRPTTIRTNARGPRKRAGFG